MQWSKAALPFGSRPKRFFNLPYQQHIYESTGITARWAVITLSDTRTESTDKSGQKVIALLTAESHATVSYQIVPDDPTAIQTCMDELFKRDDIDIILTTGGTGISRRDQTIDVIQKLIEHPLPGFGELFRMLSYSEISSGAMLSRAIAGIAGGKPIFCMPGSPAAVELAMTKLILPEIRHLLRELRK